MELDDDLSSDIGAATIAAYNTSTVDSHRHLCAVVGAMSQELKDQSVTLSPVAYFCATVSSLHHLSSSAATTASVDSLLLFLSLTLPRVPPAVLRKKQRQTLDLVANVLRLGSGSPRDRHRDGTVAGVKCLGILLGVKCGGSWSDFQQFYEVLLGFVTNPDPQVRRESHSCIRDVLQSYQGSTFLGPASEGFTNMFTRLLLLDGSSKGGVAAEKGAQEILHVLEALKDCLPYISKKYKTAILKYYKTLLGLRQPLVTRRVTDSLNILCIHPSVEVPAEVLVDLLVSLAVSVPMEQTSADGMTFTARLLDVGMRKVHTLNRDICVDKLPPVLSALQDIMGSGFEEAKFAATEAMKNLIQSCVDEELIEQGVNRLLNNKDLKTGKSAPSIIEKICATVASLLDNRYRDEWDMGFQIISLMFDKLGKSSSILLRGTLECLASMEKESDGDLPERKQLEECVGSALQAMGPEVFLGIIPLNLEPDKLSELNGWLFPILKHYTIGARLRFYVESFLGLVGDLKKKSRKLNLEGHAEVSQNVDKILYHVWTLLPSFCNYPLDTAESFHLLKEKLCNALSEEPDLLGIICYSLQVLIQQNKSIIEGSNYVPTEKLSPSTERAISYYNQEVASANLGVLRSSAKEFLSVLSKVFLKSTNDPGGSLQSTISEFASIADKHVVNKSFGATMNKLLKVILAAGRVEDSRNSMQIDNSSSHESPSRARAQLFDLAVSFLPGLDSERIDVLCSAIFPSLKDGDGLVQKKAYKVLSMMLKNSDGFISRKLEELLKLMIDALPSCHFSAKRHRLDCLYHLIVHAAKDEAEQRRGEIISSFLTEILLALKEANKKTRNRAYDILVQIGHACGDEEMGGNKENLFQLFNMIAGGLAGETPHMVSAAVKGLARLAYEFSDLITSAYNVLPSSFLLLQRKNREIIKANLGLLKVLVAKSPAEYLQNHLNVMVDGLLKWQDDTKNHFKAKVKHLLEMLVKKCGHDAVKAVMPEEHMKLLTNIRKIKERRERKLAANSETGSYKSKATKSRQSEWGDTKIFSDFDDETSYGDYMEAETATGRRSVSSSKFKSRASSSRSRRTAKSAETSSRNLLQSEDEPLDLLDQRKTRLALRSGGHLKRKLDQDEEPEFDDEGRLIVHEEGKRKREKSHDYESEDEKRTEVASLVSTVNSKKGREKRQKTSKSGWSYTGSEYGSKKGGGDLKKKGKLEPYAYWPLDRKMLSRRPEHKAAARRGMSSVVHMTKKLEGKSVATALKSMNKKK